MAKRKGSKKNSVQNVRVLDQYAGTDSGRIARMFNNIQNSQAQTRVVCSDCYTVVAATTATNANVSASQVATTDDFLSLIAQYETYRVTAIQFDIYDVNPSLSATGFFGTFHDNFTSSAQPTYTAAAVVDSIDGQIVPPGTGKLTLTWMARGSDEMGFNRANSPYQDFGGLRYSINAATTAGPKYQVYFKAIVDFRGKY
jgi:hypothetical protein